MSFPERELPRVDDLNGWCEMETSMFTSSAWMETHAHRNHDLLSRRLGVRDKDSRTTPIQLFCLKGGPEFE
jgi:hypothetical protein